MEELPNRDSLVVLKKSVNLFTKWSKVAEFGFPKARANTPLKNHTILSEI